MNALDTKKGLGRGLASLLGEINAGAQAIEANLRPGQQTVPIGQIYPGPFQPRRDFDAEALAELAQSLRQHGVLQPLLLRRDPADANRYQIVAGERRWRAAQLAQLHEVPAVIKEWTDSEAMQAALIENIQRQDLNPIEEAIAYRRLSEEFRYTQDQIAKGLGKSRSHVTNLIRLLDLPKSVREQIQTGVISISQARLLLGADNAAELADAMVEKQMNVRQAEQFINAEKQNALGARVIGLTERAKFNPNAAQRNQAANGNPATGEKLPGNAGPDADTRDLAKQLSQLLGLRVEIQFQGKAGQLVIHYQNLDQLDDVLRRLGK
jgi:ParB family transcriptional regulator, chromosome partitioning protein